MNVLLIGGGGREHALAWAVKKSPQIGTLFLAPGNPGMKNLGELVSIDTSNHEEVLEFIEENNVELTIVGPEKPLVEGLVDYLEDHDKKAFGPSEAAAQLEGSKSFAKEIMKKYDIPTAGFRSYEREEWSEAQKFVESTNVFPLVLKADGLAAGKGVFVCKNRDEAQKALEYLQNDPALSAASYRLVIEEFMEGEEVSVFAICDGEESKILAWAQDHKRIGEGDTGLNTGGMGAYSPAPILDADGVRNIHQTIIQPVIDGMASEGIPYKGVLYCGLMMTSEGPKVVEFNCRFGDPECQVMLPALKTDIIDVMVAAANGKLGHINIEVSSDYYTCIVLASEGYPGAYEKGKKITGTSDLPEDILLFHCGTTENESGELLTNGGRVLNVVAGGKTLRGSVEKAYQAVDKIHFDGMYFRRDIAKKGLTKTGA